MRDAMLIRDLMSRPLIRSSSTAKVSEALHRMHECVFGVLALESEPIDPRL